MNVNPNIPGSDDAAIVGVIVPGAKTANTYATGWIDMRDFQKISAIISTGAMGTAATCNAKLIAAKDGSGGTPLDITGKAITALTQAASGADKQAIINLRAEEMAEMADYTHVQLSVTTAVESVGLAAVVLGFNRRYGRAVAADLASVVQIVA